VTGLRAGVQAEQGLHARGRGRVRAGVAEPGPRMGLRRATPGTAPRPRRRVRAEGAHRGWELHRGAAAGHAWGMGRAPPCGEGAQGDWGQGRGSRAGEGATGQGAALGRGSLRV
jgi:hypothetical protein